MFICVLYMLCMFLVVVFIVVVRQVSDGVVVRCCFCVLVCCAHICCICVFVSLLCLSLFGTCCQKVYWCRCVGVVLSCFVVGHVKLVWVLFVDVVEVVEIVEVEAKVFV